MEVKLKMKGTYSGHNIKANGIVNLNFNFEYTELTNIVPLIQTLNNNIDVVCKVEGKVMKLGNFMLNQVKINHDGSSNVRFNSIVDNTEIDNLNNLFGDEIMLQVKAKIELEGSEEDE